MSLGFTGGQNAAPTDATYITQTPSATLTGEQALSVLASGLLKSATGTGIVSIAAAGVDYIDAGGQAGSVVNATLTTALTVNTGTVTLTGNVANTSALTLGAGASSVSGSNTGDNTVATALTGNPSIAVTDIDLGNADTTLTRTGAGAIAVEGVAVLLSGGALGTPASGTLSGCSGYPAASTAVAGVAPQATAPGAGLYNYLGITNAETAYTCKALFDATAPSTQAFGDAAATGSAAVAARRDHVHQMMAAPTTVSGNAGTVTNATLTTALTVNGGTLTLTADAANNSVVTVGPGVVGLSGSNTGDNTVATGLTGTPSITVNTVTTTGSIELGNASDCTITRTGAGAITLEGVAVPTASSTTTLTNKRITKRVVTTTDDATAVIDVDITDVYELTAVANATVFTLTGTPTDGQMLMVRFKDAGAAKGLTWTGFTALGVTIPITTVISKWCYVGCTYNTAATTWHVIAVSQEA